MGQYKLQTDNIIGLIILYIQNTFNIMSNSLQSIIMDQICLIQIKFLTVFQLHGPLCVYLNDICVYLNDNIQIMRLFIGNNRNNRLFVYNCIECRIKRRFKGIRKA